MSNLENVDTWMAVIKNVQVQTQSILIVEMEQSVFGAYVLRSDYLKLLEEYKKNKE